ncbi:MAG TPA: hypothetical protein PLO71_15030, partial [Thauera phenylacetica]|nr:hypothetical protein [Thauera phenylacetica]
MPLPIAPTPLFTMRRGEGERLAAAAAPTGWSIAGVRWAIAGARWAIAGARWAIGGARWAIGGV